MFDWIPLYNEIANKLLAYKNHRKELIKLLQQMKKNGYAVIPLNDKSTKISNANETLQDIDPFTSFANFNRGIEKKRKLNSLNILCANGY